MVSPYLTTLQHLAAKTETTEGTDSVPADVDVVAPVFDLEWSPTINVPDRNPVSGTMSKPQRVSGDQMSTPDAKDVPPIHTTFEPSASMRYAPLGSRSDRKKILAGAGAGEAAAPSVGVGVGVGAGVGDG